MNLDLEDLTSFIRMLLDLIKSLSNEVGFKINVQKLMVLYAPVTNLLRRKFERYPICAMFKK